MYSLAFFPLAIVSFVVWQTFFLHSPHSGSFFRRGLRDRFLSSSVRVGSFSLSAWKDLGRRGCVSVFIFSRLLLRQVGALRERWSTSSWFEGAKNFLSLYAEVFLFVFPVWFSRSVCNWYHAKTPFIFFLLARGEFERYTAFLNSIPYTLFLSVFGALSIWKRDTDLVVFPIFYLPPIYPTHSLSLSIGESSLHFHLDRWTIPGRRYNFSVRSCFPYSSNVDLYTTIGPRQVGPISL